MADQKPVHGTFCWNELTTNDTAAAGKFYSELIGWKTDTDSMSGMDYTVLKNDDKDAGGMMAFPPDMPEGTPPHWMAYITVDDVDACAKKTVELGGMVLHGPADIPEVGRFCVISDPTGAVVGLITFPSK
jgi:predicted enzyme related to lactoylglutathione lyase